jgi:hypothetical protein
MKHPVGTLVHSKCSINGDRLMIQVVNISPSALSPLQHFKSSQSSKTMPEGSGPAIWARRTMAWEEMIIGTREDTTTGH